MNQTIHTHQVIHAFARKDDVPNLHVRGGETGSSRTCERNDKRGHSVAARGVVTAVLLLVPLIMTELVIGAVAPDGWFAGVLNQTAQLLALARPF